MSLSILTDRIATWWGQIYTWGFKSSKNENFKSNKSKMYHLKVARFKCIISKEGKLISSAQINVICKVMLFYISKIT